MISDFLYTFLISASPLGEARVGIPFGILRGIHPLWALVIGLFGNMLVYPALTKLLDKFHLQFWKFRFYRKQSLRVAQRAKKGVGNQIQRYGFWGLMLFVMIPLPVTGAYIATIAAYIFNVRRKHAFVAICIGVLVSCGLITAGTYLGKVGFSQI